MRKLLRCNPLALTVIAIVCAATAGDVLAQDAGAFEAYVELSPGTPVTMAGYCTSSAHEETGPPS